MLPLPSRLLSPSPSLASGKAPGGPGVAEDEADFDRCRMRVEPGPVRADDDIDDGATERLNFGYAGAQPLLR